MSKLRLIGDIHGAWTYYKDHLIDPNIPSVQVGDFGYGFNYSKDALMLHWQEENPTQRFIRGNHDNVKVCRKSKNYILDGWREEDGSGIMYVGGAWSIDYGLRREDVDWWADEENSTQDFEYIYECYKEMKPRIMITHDAPLHPASWIGLLPKGSFQMVTRTALWLERMRQVHKPDLWVFGHWHKSVDRTAEGTRFVCLGIEEVKDLDLDTLEMT